MSRSRQVDLNDDVERRPSWVRRRDDVKEWSSMEQSEVMERVVKILTPWVKDESALGAVSMETNILEDLKVNSARLVDVVIAFEDDFDIEIADEDVDKVNTVGDAVNLISGKL
jgi:acyl carrier protein